MNDGKSSYSIILGREWIHNSECVPSTLHQNSMFRVGDKVKTIKAYCNPFLIVVKMFEALLYSPHLSPMTIPKEYDE